MKDDKYYVPEIEEFHVGFEYEEIDIEMKYKNTFYGEYPEVSIFNYSDCFNSIEEKIKDGEIRVKYLDKEDIESLDWGLQWKKDFKDHVVYVFGKDKIYTLNFELPSRKISVLKHIINDRVEYSFVSTVKNISELKELIKQNIK